jgi:hypothetical protein
MYEEKEAVTIIEKMINFYYLLILLIRAVVDMSLPAITRGTVCNNWRQGQGCNIIRQIVYINEIDLLLDGCPVGWREGCPVGCLDGCDDGYRKKDRKITIKIRIMR